MVLELTILGTSSATPTVDRHPSAQYLNFGKHSFLLDCGEGCQIQMLRFGVRSFKINKIFISHLHPDHYLGLPGLLSSYSLKGRTEPLEIYAPEGMKEILEVQFKYGDVFIGYPITYITLKPGMQTVYHDKNISIYSFELQHRLKCWGFIFKEEKMPRKVRKDVAEIAKLPPNAFSMLRKGKDFIDQQGNVYKNEEYTIASPPPASYAYITDTLYLPELAKELRSLNIDLLYHEATFLDELKHKAQSTHHSTAKEAAEFATIAGVKKLLIGHYSSRYKDVQPLLVEAQAVFSNTELAEEGKVFTA
jgi:ribonuclease Z